MLKLARGTLLSVKHNLCNGSGMPNPCTSGKAVSRLYPDSQADKIVPSGVFCA